MNMNFKNNQESQDDELETDDEIIVENNVIYFYSDVSRKSISKLCKQISILENKLLNLKASYRLEENPKIYLHIQSDGGDAYAGLSCMDTLRNCRLPVVTIVDGFVASAATFILIGGTIRKMNKHSNILIHQIRTWFSGKYNDLCDELSNCKNLMTTVKKIYKENSSVPIKQLDSMLNKELNLSPSECLKYGLIHEII